MPRRRSIVALFGILGAIGAVALAVSLADERSRGLLRNTFELAGGTLLIALPAGALLGLVLARTDVWGRRVAMALVGALLLVPLYLQAAAWQAGFGIEGWQTALQSSDYRSPWLDRWRGAIWVHGCAGIPWVALFVGVASRTIPRAWEESALLDLSLGGVFKRVTLRCVLPAAVLGALWVAITTMGEMSVTDMFAIRTYAEELYVNLNAGSWNGLIGVMLEDEGPVPAGVGIVVMAIAATFAIVIARGVNVVSSRPPHGPSLVFRLDRGRIALGLLTWLVVGAIVMLPVGSLIYKAGSLVTQTETGYERAWSAWKAIEMTLRSPSDHVQELYWSLAMGLSTAAATLLVTIPLAYAACTSRAAAAVGSLIAVVGLALPGPLLSLGLITVFNDPAFPWLNYLYDRTIAVPVIAQVVRAFPLAFFLVWHALRTIPRSLGEAALLDGAGPMARLWLALRQRPIALALAAVAACIVSVGELGATILVVPPGIEPLSVRIFTLLHYNVEDQVAAITLMLIVLFAAASWTLFGVARRLFRVG